MELNEVLSDKAQEAPVEKAAPAEKTVETVEPVSSTRRAHQEREKAAREPKVEEPVVKPEEPKAEVKVEKPEVREEMTPKERAFLAQAKDEREKRQELERRLQALEATKTPQEPPKQFWDDPEASMNTFRQEMTREVTNTRLNTAEMIARSKYQDFDEKLAIFGQIIHNTPGLWQHAVNSPDPAEFAYRTAKNFKDLQDAGNLDSMKANMEKEIRLKVEAEFKSKQEASEKERSSIPPSLSEARGTTGNKVVWNGPTPMDSILHD